jgi:hypothetical protein
VIEYLKQKEYITSDEVKRSRWFNENNISKSKRI